MPKPETYSDIRDLQSIVDSPALRRVLEERKEFIQKEVNRFVREQNIIQAYGSLARLDDIDRFIGVIKTKVDELKKES